MERDERATLGGASSLATDKGTDTIMALFEDRKKGQENKYARDRELAFKVTVRRNKLLGLWLAERLGKTGDDAEAYARAVVEADFNRPGDGDVVEKVMADIKAAGLDIDERKLRARMEALEGEARAQVRAE